MLFKRKKYLNLLYNYLKTEKLIILYGARQVGKTTLLKILLEDKDLSIDKKYVNIDDIYERKFSTKDEFINYFSFNYGVDFYKESLLFLDEIQTINNIEQILKSLYDDEKVKAKIIATGSGLWQIQKLGSSLVGRVKQIWVYPFSFFEFLEYKGIDSYFLTWQKYDEFMFEKIEYLLEEYYKFGGYPSIIMKQTKEEKILELSNIVDLYLKKDVSFFLKGNEIINFKKLFSYLASSISSGLNISNLSSYLSISRDKVEYYLEILEKSFLLYKVLPFYSDARKEYSKQTEFFLNDLGIISYFRNDFSFKGFEGQVIENFVYLELLKNKKIFSDEIKTYNKINGSEIDFVYVYKEGGVIPIESKITNNDIIPKIFSSFGVEYGNSIKYFVRTSTNLKAERILNNKKVQIMPFWMIGEMI